MSKIGIFRGEVARVGGIETWLYSLAKKFGSTHDITLYYSNIAKEQLDKIGRLIKCVQYDDEPIVVDTAIFCYDCLGLDKVKAKRVIHMIHADYKYAFQNDFKRWIDWVKDWHEIYAVSKVSAKHASHLLGRKVKVMYNPVIYDKPPRPIRIMSATRLTKEKGGKRMVKLAKALDKSGVEYVWDIYTAEKQSSDIAQELLKYNGVKLHKPIRNVMKMMSKYDVVVSMSDTESYGYTNVESLVTRRILVTTNLPVHKELGISRENAIIVPLRKSFSNYKKIVKKIVARSPLVVPESDWSEIVGKPSGQYYKPVVVQSMLEYDVMLSDGRWLLPKEVAVVDISESEYSFLKRIK